MQPTATVQGLPGKVSTLNTWFNVPGGALGRGFKHRLLPSPKTGDRDRDSSCSSRDCNVAPREVIEQLNHASDPSPASVPHRQFLLRRNLRKGEHVRGRGSTPWMVLTI